MSRRRHNNRGFAMLMALAALGVVAVTLLVLSRHFADDMLRTRNLTREAQLSQLLLAGAQDAVQRSHSWSAELQKQEWQIKLPAELSSSGAKLSIALVPSSDQKVDATIEAKMGRGIAVQTLHFKLAEGNWIIESVELAGAK